MRKASDAAVIRAVVFDLDGVLIESEQLWDQARRHVVAVHGDGWPDDGTAAMQGMSSGEWAQYLHDSLGVELPTNEITDLVVDDLLARYREHLPLLPGAVGAVHRLGARWPLGLASSSNRVVIDTVLRAAGLTTAFAATLSSEEVPRGKPAPDVYLEIARRLQRPPGDCAAVEDSTNGIRSAVAAGLRVIAVPNHDYPPRKDSLSEAAVVLDDLNELSVGIVAAL
jgi:HAD superfamily hydrolase (TIGR01509 family)